MNGYEDIIYLSHHQSETRPHMSLADRAAQFSPFSALTGYGDAVEETARLTAPEKKLSEDKKAELDRKLEIIRSCLPACPEVSLTYFVRDTKKEGGEYLTVRTKIRKIDSCGRRIVLSDGTGIPVDHIADISGDHF